MATVDTSLGTLNTLNAPFGTVYQKPGDNNYYTLTTGSGGQFLSPISKDQFYGMLGTVTNPNSFADTFASNPYGISYQELQSVFNGSSPVPSSSSTGTSGGTTTGGTSATGTASASTVDANTLAQYDQAINNVNSGINRLPGQLSSGNTTIDNSYQDALNQLLLGKNQGEAAYNTNKQQSATDYVGAKNTIGSQAGSTLNGLLRLLGSRGAGGSSAYNIAAPQAVARGAGLQRADVANTFGANNQALDTNWNNYLTGYNNEVSSAGSQRDQNKQNLQSQIDASKASLLQTLATLQGNRATAAGGNPVSAAQPYLDQANTLLDKNYTTPQINYQTQAYQAPSVASYTVAPNATPTFNNSGATDYFSPYLQQLLGKKQATPIGA